LAGCRSQASGREGAELVVRQLAKRGELESGFELLEEVRLSMRAHAGDLIVVESERVAQSGRRGVIEEVLKEEPPRFRVRWDDGHTTLFAPSSGVARIEARTQKGKS